MVLPGTVRRWPWLTVAAAVLSGCSDSLPTAAELPPIGANLQITATLPAAAVATIVVEVSAADIATTQVFPLALANGIASGSVRVPAGSGRAVTVRAYDDGGIETYSGSAVTDVRSGVSTSLRIELSAVTGEVVVEAVGAGARGSIAVLEVNAPDFQTAQVFNLPIVGGTARGTVTLLVGSGRRFAVRAYDRDGFQTHHGAVTVAVRTGDSVHVALTPL